VAELSVDVKIGEDWTEDGLDGLGEGLSVWERFEMQRGKLA
jgi:hypothetical protein